MSTTTKSNARSGSNDESAASVRHEDDLYGWVDDQVKLLRADEVASIDLSHITRGLSDMGRSEFNKLVSTIRIVLHHLMKWDHQPERRSRSWATTIREHRRRISYLVKDSPSLKPTIDEAIIRAYPGAVDDVNQETGLPGGNFPETCPYHWDDITLRPISWD